MPSDVRRWLTQSPEARPSSSASSRPSDCCRTHRRCRSAPCIHASVRRCLPWGRSRFASARMSCRSSDFAVRRAAAPPVASVAWRLSKFAAAACLVAGAFMLGQKTASRITPWSRIRRPPHLRPHFSRDRGSQSGSCRQRPVQQQVAEVAAPQPRPQSPRPRSLPLPVTKARPAPVARGCRRCSQAQSRSRAATGCSEAASRSAPVRRRSQARSTAPPPVRRVAEGICPDLRLSPRRTDAASAVHPSSARAA